MDGKTPENIELLEDGVTFRYFPSWSPLLFSPAMVKWFKMYLKLFDIVHIHSLYRFPVTVAAWWARRTGVPYLIMPHGSLDPFLFKQSQYNLPLKRIYECLFDIPNLNHAAAVHYTVEEEAQRAAFLKLRTKPVILPYGIDWEGYRRLPPQGSFRRRIKLNDQVPLVLFLGRINFKKGLDLLVPAFGRVVQKLPDARLAVVGPDNEGYSSKVREWCVEQGIQDKVFFVDHLGLEKVKEAYVDADVFVLPSYTENFGLTVVEAMACGTPVIISDQVNICREVHRSRAGIVVSLDPCAVADAIYRVLVDKELASDMGRQGRRAAERYAWPHIVEQLTKIYIKLLNEETLGGRFLK
jgi:glycosyltransferase involved in cell wall biosynthesis